MLTILRLTRRWVRLLALGFSAVCGCGPLSGQTGVPAALRPRLEIHGQVRSRMEIWDWFGAEPGSSYAYFGSLARLSVGETRPSLDWQAEFAGPVLLGLPDDAIGAGARGQEGLGATYFAANQRQRNAVMAFPKQVYVRIKNVGGVAGQSLRLGRFEYGDGTEVVPRDATLAAMKRERVASRLIGTFAFTHVGRSFDGLHYVLNRPRTNLTLMAVIPTRGVFQVDGWGVNKTFLSYGALTRQVAGQGHAGEWRLFGIYYHDWRNVLKVDNRPLAVRQNDRASLRLGTFGGHYLHAVPTSAGIVDAMFWGVWQTGRWGLLDHRAAAVDIELGYQPPAPRKVKPWLRAGYTASTGDSDPNDSRHETFFQVAPTPRVYAKYPFYNMINNQDAFGIAVLRPHAKFTVTVEAHALRLAHRRDLWQLGGGVFHPWSFGFPGRPSSGARSLANLYDTTVEVKTNAHVTVSGYFGYAAARSVITAIYGNEKKDGTFGYLELLYRF